MRQGTPTIAALDRALDLLQAIVSDGGASNISALASQHDVPPASLHRICLTLERKGFLQEIGRGRYGGGPVLEKLARQTGSQPLLARVARPIVTALADRIGAVVHLGILDQDMVTYLIKAGEDAALFTREGMQLEAYCSAVGKILLAHLPADRQAAYLGEGPFVALTPNTRTEPDAIRAEWKAILRSGFACDDREISPDLRCLAVPVKVSGEVEAGLSVSMLDPIPPTAPDAHLLRELRKAARTIGLATERLRAGEMKQPVQ